MLFILAQNNKERREENKQNSLFLYKRVILLDPNNAAANNQIGLCYFKGIGTVEDKTKAKSYFIKASELGSKNAQCNLIEICDNEEFIQLLKKHASIPGNYQAMMTLSYCYAEGVHTEKNEEKARFYLEEALKVELIDACYNYGSSVLNGTLGYEKNPQEGLKYLKIASQKGDSFASNYITFTYKEGKVVEQDLEKEIEITFLSEYISNHLEDEDFIYDLGDILQKLPSSRESVIILLDAIECYDIRELYEEIFDDRFEKYLTKEEYKTLRHKYDCVFEPFLEET